MKSVQEVEAPVQQWRHAPWFDIVSWTLQQNAQWSDHYVSN